LARENFFIPSAPDRIHQEVSQVRQFISQNLGHGEAPIVVANRESGFSGQKLNFPPPIVRTSIPDTTNTSGGFAYTYTGYSNPLVFNAESTYIPATSVNQPENKAPEGTQGQSGSGESAKK
jgi:hypothetical protein